MPPPGISGTMVEALTSGLNAPQRRIHPRYTARTVEALMRRRLAAFSRQGTCITAHGVQALADQGITETPGRADRYTHLISYRLRLQGHTGIAFTVTPRDLGPTDPRMQVPGVLHLKWECSICDTHGTTGEDDPLSHTTTAHSGCEVLFQGPGARPDDLRLEAVRRVVDALTAAGHRPGIVTRGLFARDNPEYLGRTTDGFMVGVVRLAAQGERGTVWINHVRDGRAAEGTPEIPAYVQTLIEAGFTSLGHNVRSATISVD